MGTYVYSWVFSKNFGFFWSFFFCCWGEGFGTLRVDKRVAFQKGGFGGCSPETKTGTRVHPDVPPERKTGTRVRSDVPPERKPEQGEHSPKPPLITKPPFVYRGEFPAPQYPDKTFLKSFFALLICDPPDLAEESKPSPSQVVKKSGRKKP